MNQTFGGRLGQWLTLHTLGRKPRAKEFNEEIAETIRRQWPRPLNGAAAIVTADDVLLFAERVAHYCPSRWNAMVSAIQFITPEGRCLERRALKSKERPSLTQLEFSQLLKESDGLARSKAGLVVRFLAQTGMRITEARGLRPEHVKSDHFNLPGTITKNGDPRCVPFIPGVRETLRRLRAIGDGEFVLPQESARMGIYKACERAGLPRMTHHDFRHLFVTRCIESGVDLPTVARWLGHRDKGALLAKRYFHLLDQHSRRMARKVRV